MSRLLVMELLHVATLSFKLSPVILAWDQQGFPISGLCHIYPVTLAGQSVKGRAKPSRNHLVLWSTVDGPRSLPEETSFLLA